MGTPPALKRHSATIRMAVGQLRVFKAPQALGCCAFNILKSARLIDIVALWRFEKGGLPPCHIFRPLLTACAKVTFPRILEAGPVIAFWSAAVGQANGLGNDMEIPQQAGELS